MSVRNPVLLVSLLALAACSMAPLKPPTITRGDYSYTKQYMSWFIEKEMNQNDVTGLSIALVDDQQVVWAQGFGYEDEKAGIKASPDTVYQLGSIAKVLTATAAMQLAERGRMNIDQPLQKYLPEFSIKSRFGDTGGITPRNIMTHHSGLPGYWVRGMSERHPHPFTEQIVAVRDEYVAWPPNYVFDYSNLGVSLLGAALGKVSGEGYAEYLDSHLLKPLGMTHSEFAARIPGKAYKEGKEVEAIPLRDLPSSGLNSSAGDMAHFIQMVFADGKFAGQQIISADSLREMFKVQNANVPLDFDFKMGLGWMLSGVDVPHAGIVASHGGTTLNYHTMMAVLPEHKLGVVVLSNSANAQAVVAEVSEAMLQLALEAKTGIARPKKEFVEPESAPLSEADLHDYTGYFETPMGPVKIENRDGALITELMGFDFELVKHADNKFGVNLKLFGFIPLASRQMKEINLSLHRIGGREVLTYEASGQTMLLGEKLHPMPLPDYLNDYVGEYDIVNPYDGPMPENIRVVREGDLLIGEFNSSVMPRIMFRSIVLRTTFLPVAPNELIMAGLGSGKGETLHLAKVGGEAHIYFSGFDLRKKSN